MTAVEYLVLHLNKQEWFTHKQKQYIDQAKEMERQQKIDFAEAFYDSLFQDAESYPQLFIS
jgi:hypothetical protein